MKTIKRKKGIFAAVVTAGILCASVCSFAISDFTENGTQADAYTSATTPTANAIGEITLSGYEKRSDGLTFDGTKLNQLFGKLVQAATGTPTAKSDLATAKSKISSSSSSVTGTANTGNTNTQTKALGFNTMQTQLGAPITLDFGGLSWTVVYATTNTTAGANTQAGDLIVTLWLNDNVSTASKWSAATASTDVSGNYPTNMYSSSFIRVSALNAGGDDGTSAGNTSSDGTTYSANSTTARAGSVSLADRKSNQFAKYTLSNSVLGTSSDPNPSLAGYLTMPKNVEYQRAENWVWSYNGTGNPYLLPNEAWGSGTDGVSGPNTALRHTKGSRTGGWYTGSPSNISVLPSKPAYYEWSNDYLWLPSLTETGYYTSGSDYGSSLWGIPANDNVIKSTRPSGTTTDVSWLRSGQLYNASISYSISSAGASVWPSVSEVGGVRPALHLNLSSAALSAAVEIPEPPSSVTKEYTGSNLFLSGESWYDTTVFDNSSLCAVTYVNPDTNATVTPKDAGKYKVKFELKTSKYSWGGGDKTVKKREVTYTISKKTLRVDFKVDTATGVPTLALASGESPYSGDNASPGDFELKIRYYDTEGNDLGTNLSALSKGVQYQAVAEFGGKRGDNYEPDDKSRLTFTNPATRVTTKWQQSVKTYSGSAQVFNLAVQGGAFTSALAGSYSSDVEQLSNTRFQAVNAGKYGVRLTLTNKNECVWDETGRSDDLTVYFEVKPLEVTLNILSFSPADRSVTYGNKMKATIELPSILDTVTLQLAAYWSGTLVDNLCAINLNSDPMHSEEFELGTDNSSFTPDTYELKLDFDDPSDPSAQNYKFKFDQDYTITVKEPSATGGINWRLMAGSQSAGYKSDSGDTNSTTFDSKIPYDGRSYSFTVNASGIGYTVDNSYNDDGFTNGYKTVAKGNTVPLGAVKDAGEYVTYVRLKKNGEPDAEYSISWKIDKAVFNLSGVRWIDDGKIVYKEGSISVELDPDTIPAGLTPTYGGSHTATFAGQTGIASVTFTVADTKNYVVPDKSVGGSYTFVDTSGTLTDFEWSKNWEIVAAVIPVDWTNGTITVNNKKINAAVLAGGYDAYLDYVYYETDSMGNILDPSAPALSEPAVVDGTVKYYIAEVSIKSAFSAGYKLDPSAASYRSSVFEVGHTLTAVQLSAQKTSYIYWGNAVKFQFKVTQGAIAESAFDLIYYKGQTRLVNPPKDVGNYTVQINLKNSYIKQYYIDGVSTFEFTIERATIKNDWNMGTKPPSLKLNAGEKACISYEYCNASGNPVSLSMIRDNPGNYSVRAVIKSSALKNYTFKDASGNDVAYTDWVNFTVNAGDTIIDPDTSVPTNPSVDPNDPSSGTDPSGKTKVTLTLMNATAEFNGQNQAAQFANSAGLPESAFIITYKQNGQVVSEYSAAGVYQIEVSLAPSYAELYELSGTTSFIYLITGGNGNNTTTPGGGDNPSENTIESILPIILSGVSLVMIVVFAIMAANNASAANNAKDKAKKLAQVSYSVSPASLLLLFGLSQTNWWIIAGVLMGLALVMAIVMFMFRKKKLKAFAMLEEEQSRVDQEREFARQDEQRRRDEELRMMFAAMQQGSQQSFNLDALQGSIQSMISSTVSALLPAVQQMQALPPASGDGNVYVMQNPEADALREQLASQQEQMAEQQQLLAQILQNQQKQQEALAEALYEEPESGDDLSWLGESEEFVSLEESYGALSDERKRFYYEIGSYIMNKSRTSQNDGRYAVLFRYRGRTIFKLCIKDNAPVLYYPSDNGGRAEVRIASASDLEIAKGVIDRHILRVDAQLN